MQQTPQYDLCVIGAGITGLMVAYELVHRGLKITVLEASHSVGQGITADQPEVIHVLQPPFGSLKSKLAMEGNALYDELCAKLEVPLKRLPAILVTTSYIGLLFLLIGYFYLKLKRKFRLSLKGRKALLQLEDALSDCVKGGIVVEGYAIVDSRALVQRLYEHLKEKVEFHFNCEVLRGDFDGVFRIHTKSSSFVCSCVVNAAGLYADEVARNFGVDAPYVTPGLGVMAEYTDLRVDAIITRFSLLQKRTKGGAIIPTIRGNVIFGPGLRLAKSKEDRGVTDDDLRELESKFSPLIKKRGKLVRIFAGIRPLSPTKDFIVLESHQGRMISLIGIESPGLTASPALARLVAKRVERVFDRGGLK
jgi:glycerol-3-phosphate dehydrogenase